MKNIGSAKLCPLCEIDGYYTVVRNVVIGTKPPYTSMDREFGFCRNCGQFPTDEVSERKKYYTPIPVKQSKFFDRLGVFLVWIFFILIIWGLLWLGMMLFHDPESFAPENPCFIFQYRLLHAYECISGK